MRKLAWFAGSFAAGIFMVQYGLPEAFLLPAAFACLGLGIAAMLLAEDRRRRWVLLLVGLSLAFGYHWLFLRQVVHPAEEHIGSTETVTMTLCEAPQPREEGAKVTVRIQGIPGKAVYYGGEELLKWQAGQEISGEAALQSAARIRNEEVDTFTSKGVFLLAYQRGEVIPGRDGSRDLRWLSARAGNAMHAAVSALFHGEVRGLIRSILTGDRSGLSVQSRNDLSEAGLAHILAVSGMHCMYLLLLLQFLFGDKNRYAIFPVLCFYAMLTGGTPSVVRACIMLMVLSLSRILERDNDPPTACGVALMLILLQNPFAARSVSLQLSFGAVAGLLWVTPGVRRWMQKKLPENEVTDFVIASVSATIGCLALTMPLSAFYFGRVSLIGVVSNLLCLWLVGGLFVSALLTVLAGILWLPLGGVMAVVPAALATVILKLAHFLANVPYHGISMANPYLKWWILFLYILLLRRDIRLTLGLAALTLTVTVALGALRFTAPLDAVVLNVGQGQCVLLKSENRCAVVDCGSGNSWIGAGGIAADWVQTMGIRRVEMLILTHFDSDHSNGVEELLARIPVREILVPEKNEELAALAQAYGTALTVIEREESLPMGKAVLQIFPPLTGGEDNERGLSLLASAGEDDLLITGDMSGSTEAVLLESYELPEVETLVVGHHGSKYATSQELLDAIGPKRACISVGKNTYGHPAEETLRRLADCQVYRTDLQGSIHLALGGIEKGT